jgi:hypothetical protein
MARKDIPDTVRPLFEIAPNAPVIPEDKPEIANRPAEAKRVLKRIAAIIEDHRQASAPLKVEFGIDELRIVINALRDHAKGGAGAVETDGKDEMKDYCLTRLFEELVEEPSNILYTTSTGPDTIRYDAMESAFWIECLDLLEKNYRPQES